MNLIKKILFNKSTPQESFLAWTQYSPALGKRQKEVCDMLLEGHHIAVFVNSSDVTEERWISDKEKDNIYQLPKGMLGALLKRGLVEGKSTHTTVQPDTDYIEFTLRPEVIAWVDWASIQ